MKTELSTTIIRGGPRLFENISRRARIKKRTGRDTLRNLAGAIDPRRRTQCRALRNGDTGNARFHFHAFLLFKRLAAPRSDKARKLFGFGRQGNRQCILQRECFGSSAFLLYPLRAAETIFSSEAPDFEGLFVHSEATSCRIASVKSVKMMHRPVAVADGETIGGGDGGADPGLGVAHGGFHVLALGEASGDG